MVEKQLADHSIPIGSIKEILGYNIRDKLAAFVLIFCFCDFVLNAIFNRIMGEFVGQAFYKMLIVDMVLLLPVTLCSFMCGKKTKSTVWPLYFLHGYCIQNIRHGSCMMILEFLVVFLLFQV